MRWTFSRVIALVLVPLAGLTASYPAQASGVDDAVLAVHLQRDTRAALCEDALASSCGGYSVSGDVMTSYTMYLVAYGVGEPTLKSVSLGIDFHNSGFLNGVNVFDWYTCADGSAPANNWPRPGGTNVFTWNEGLDGCNPGVNIEIPGEGRSQVIGFMHVMAYGGGDISITPRTDLGETGVIFTDCDDNQASLPDSRVGRASFGHNGGASPYNPCGPVIYPPPHPPTLDAPAALLMLHVQPALTQKGVCALSPSRVEDIVTEGEANPDGSLSYHVFLLVAPADSERIWGLSGVQTSIRYAASDGGAGIVVNGWTNCGDVEFPQLQWPASETGNTVTWRIANCQTEPLVTAGYFYVTAYSASTMELVPYGPTGVAKVTNCWGAEGLSESSLPLASIGWVSMGGAMLGDDDDGCNPALEPCTKQPIAVEATTWGGLKRLSR